MKNKHNFVAIDFETASQERDSACAVGVVKVVGGKIIASQSWLIDPQTYFMSAFIDIHGITPEMVKDAPLFDEVWEQVTPLLEGADFIAAHNSGFDRSVMMRCCQRYKINPPTHKYVCTVKLAKKHWGLKHAKLNQVCGYLGIELNHHDALSDALACAKIILRSIDDGL